MGSGENGPDANLNRCKLVKAWAYILALVLLFKALLGLPVTKQSCGPVKGVAL